MNELALFAGAGGGILGGHLLGWRTVCAVEWESYPASILAARQNDGILPPFPIWDDVCTFDGLPSRGPVMQGLPHPVHAGTVNWLLYNVPQPWTLPELTAAVAQCTPKTLAGYEPRIAESLLHEWHKAGRVRRVDGGELPRYRRA